MVWAMVLIAGAALAAGPQIDARLLGPEHNLASNCSFEAVRAGRPEAWQLYASPRNFSIVQDAVHGRFALAADAPDGYKRHTAARQYVPVKPGVEYELCVWAKVERAGADMCIFIDFRTAGGERVSIARAHIEQRLGEWQMVRLTARAPEGAAKAGLLVPYLFGPGRVVVDAVRFAPADGRVRLEPLEVGRPEVFIVRPNWLRIRWQSNCPSHRVQWRPAKRGAKWREAVSVRERVYTVVGLEPETEYEIRVVGEDVEFIDADGQRVKRRGDVYSPRIRAETAKWQARKFAGLLLWPERHLDTFPDGACYPSIEAYKGALYVVEMRGYAMYLSKVNPRGFAVEWTKKLVDRVPGCYQGLTDTCVSEGKLWIVWNRQPTAKPDYNISMSRQYLMSYDLETGEASEPIVIEPTLPGCGTWEGSVEALDGRIWVLWMEARPEGGTRRTKIAIAEYSPESGFSEPIIWRDCPTAYPYGPFLSTYEGQLVVLFSDLEALEREGREPLYWAKFDGRKFGWVQPIAQVARSRYAKGLQVGRMFLAAYKCNNRWEQKWGYMFHDIALTAIGPDPGWMETVFYADDMKYNSSPDMTMLDGKIYIVYSKWEHAYGIPGDPAFNWGTFIGVIEPE